MKIPAYMVLKPAAYEDAIRDYVIRRPLSARAKAWRKAHPEVSRTNKVLLGIYWGLIYRCYEPKSSSYRWYGAQGIAVCREWLESFAAFKAWALANGWQKGMHIDRRNSKRNYCPSNCQCLAPKEHYQKTHRLRKKKLGMLSAGGNQHANSSSTT